MWPGVNRLARKLHEEANPVRAPDGWLLCAVLGSPAGFVSTAGVFRREGLASGHH